MLVSVGYYSLIISFILCLYATFAAIYGAKTKKMAWVSSARRSLLAIFPTLSFSVIALLLLMINNHYEVEYVSSVISNTMPAYLKAVALWGGQAGSLLFWSWLMAGFALAVALRNWSQDRDYLPWVIVVIAITEAFFILLLILFENPFNRIWVFFDGQITSSFFQPFESRLFVPKDGNGLNPLLRHPGMILHPPVLYIGFVGFIIPYAFAIAALINGKNDNRWILISRRWSLIAWLFLSIGLILGARWAYDVLGWGGYWGWDPVEIAAFIPWLSGTAFIHSVIIQERRSMLKRWNMVLIILTYALVIFGTFLTRSGVLSSVHAFAQSALGPAFFIFIGITFILSLALVLHRWNDLKTETQITSLLSREAIFLYNNLIFMGILIVCLWGMLFPLISEIVSGQKVTVGAPFYKAATAPLFAILLFLMGIAPLTAWGYSTVKTLRRSLWKPALAALIIVAIIAWHESVRNVQALFGFSLVALTVTVILYEIYIEVKARYHLYDQTIRLRVPKAFGRVILHNRRRFGGYIVHIGIVLMALGVIGIELFQTETQATIPQGGEIQLQNYSIIYQSLNIFDTSDGRNIARAVVQIHHDGRDDFIYPRRDYYYDMQQPMTIPGLYSTWQEDLYVILVDWLPISTDGATFKIYHNPLVTWLWLGGLIFIIGTGITVFPQKEIPSNMIVPSSLSPDFPSKSKR